MVGNEILVFAKNIDNIETKIKAEKLNQKANKEITIMETIFN